MIFTRTIRSFLKDEEYRDLLVTTCLIVTVGSVIYHYLEGWTWIDSIYFSIITLTTVGYGDFAPQTDGGKLFTIFYIILGIGIILTFINALYLHYNNMRFGSRSHNSGTLENKTSLPIQIDRNNP